MRIRVTDRPRAALLFVGTIISFANGPSIGIAFLAGAFIASVTVE
jgi:hypothetical protein